MRFERDSETGLLIPRRKEDVQPRFCAAAPQQALLFGGGIFDPNAGPDPYLGSVKLLLHGNGTNGSTTIVDSSPVGRTTTLVSAGVSLTTSTKKYGTAAIENTSTSGNIEWGSSTDFSMPLEYTLEFWIYVPSFPSASPTTFFLATDGARYFTLSNTGVLVPGPQWYVDLPFVSATLSTGVWQFYAQTRDSSGRSRSFLNGTLLGTGGVLTTTYTTAKPFGLFGVPGRADLRSFVGVIDDLRWTPGVCRYTTSFPAPSNELSDV